MMKIGYESDRTAAGEREKHTNERENSLQLKTCKTYFVTFFFSLSNTHYAGFK